MSEAVKEVYARGTELFEKGDYESAETLLREVLAESPHYVDVLNKLGVISSMDGRFQEAAGFFEKALELNPRYIEAFLNLIITYNEMGELKKAEAVFMKLTRAIHSDSGVIDHYTAGKLANEHFRLGNIYFDYSLLDEAAEEYRKAIRLRPGLPDVLTKLGIALREKGQATEAIRYFNLSKEANPTYSPAWVHLGILYYMKGHTGLAFSEWEEALRRNPRSKEARAFLHLFRGER
jgi:tetratricopeptide (TPR) repeat protein